VRRPLLWCSLAFAAGAAAGVEWVVAADRAAAVALSLAGLSVFAAGRARVAGLLLAGAVAAAGLAVGGHAAGGPDLAFLSRQLGRKVTAEGHALTDGTRFVLRVTALGASPAGRVRVLVRGRVRVDVGDRVRVSGRLLSLPAPRNPGEPDPARFLYRHRVGAVLVADRVQVLVPGEAARLLQVAARARDALADVYRRTLREPYGAVLAGVVLGLPVPDRGIQDAFRTSGLAHLLVASGAQLTTVAAAAYVALRRLRRGARALGALAAVLTFALVAGWEPSMARAAVMAGLCALAVLARRESDPATALAATAATLLASNPLLVRDVGFQLSFAATAGLVFVAPDLEGRLRALPGLVREALAAATACQVAVAPLLVWHFGQLQPLAVTANVLALPAAAVLVPLGLAAGVVGLVWQAAALPLLWAAEAGCAYLVAVARGFASLPGATWHVTGDTQSRLAVAAVTILALLVASGRLRPARAAVLAAVAAAAAVWIRVLPPPPHAEVVFLDVGQGDGILIRTPQGHRVVVDGGPEAEPLAGALLRAGGRPDVAILSHAHADHVVGLTHALRRFGAGMVLDPGYPHPTPAYVEFLRTVEERRIPYRSARRGLRLGLGRASIEILWPPGQFVEGPSPANENSVVVSFRFGDVRFLLPGDVEGAAEASLVAWGTDLAAQVLKVPHQGSRTSSSEPFLDAVRPRLAVLSVGANPYGHPHHEVLARYARRGVVVYRTDRDGAVSVRTDGRELWVRTTRQRWCCAASWTGWRTR
jgi:competence protein ComEC